MTLQYKGVMGEPDAVRGVWANGGVCDYVGYGEHTLTELRAGNDDCRADGLEHAVIPYRIRIYIHPNKPKRGE
jgi:hypothetical protein